MTIATASPRAAPGARLKLSVTEGNCSWWAIESGAVVRTISAIALKGICALALPVVAVLTGWEGCALEVASGWVGAFAGT